MKEISDKELLKVVLAADDQLLHEGFEPKQRGLHVIPRVMEQLGYTGFAFGGEHAPPILKRVRALHTSLYRPLDLAIGGLHGGIFMFRDVFARIEIPIIFGSVGLDPLKMTDLAEMQIKWLVSRPPDLAAFFDQFTDILDFAGGIAGFDSFQRPAQASLDILQLAAFQLQSAAATLSQSFDPRGAVQSAIIGAELALKGGLAAIGVDERERKKFGHNLESIAKALSAAYPLFDAKRVIATIKRFPQYVQNRYSAVQPKRVETGRIAMGAQYIAGEVMRQVTAHSARTDFQPALERTYPPC
jgi:hypothetical protein